MEKYRHKYRHFVFVTPVFEHITREVIMRIRTTILTIILSLLFASVLPAAQRGIKVTAKTPSGKAIPLYSVHMPW